mmetsp:Transcript_41583/g.79465  ORF Transcript_41583/g.79465 Transcript_41583/m.79465 type:complete len:137 (+) Transcript_41583:104-514(+)
MNSYINEDNGIFASWAPENYEINNNNAALQPAARAAYGLELQNRIPDLQHQQRHALRAHLRALDDKAFDNTTAFQLAAQGCVQTGITTDSLTDTTSTTPAQPSAACCSWLSRTGASLLTINRDTTLNTNEMTNTNG